MTTSEFLKSAVMIVFLKSAAMIVAILLVFGLAAFGLNFYTQPIIEANNAGAANGLLIEVLPNGKNFEELDPAALNLPENVLKAHKETNGAGFVFEVTSTGYQSGLVIRVGVDADGKVTGSTVVSSNETWGQEASLNGAYNGKDSSTLELIIAAGATPNSATSIGYNKAIEGALNAYVLAAGGKLDPSIVFEGMLPSLHTGLVNNGSLVVEEGNVSGNIVKAWKSTNTTGAAYVMTKGEAAYLVIVNNAGHAVVYDESKNDVTADHSDLVTEALAAYGEVSNTLTTAVKRKIKSLFNEDAQNSAEKITFKSFGTVSVAAKFTYNGETIYMFQTKPFTYGNSVMTVYTFINENGEIVKQDTSTLIYDHYSVNGYMSNKDQPFIDWLNQYSGKTEATLGDDLLITGATLSSTAVKNATADAFAAFNSIKGGEQ